MKEIKIFCESNDTIIVGRSSSLCHWWTKQKHKYYNTNSPEGKLTEDRRNLVKQVFDNYDRNKCNVCGKHPNDYLTKDRCVCAKSLDEFTCEADLRKYLKKS